MSRYKPTEEEKKLLQSIADRVGCPNVDYIGSIRFMTSVGKTKNELAMRAVERFHAPRKKRERSKEYYQGMISYLAQLSDKDYKIIISS